MSTNPGRRSVRWLLCGAAVVLMALVAACEEDQAPPLATGISIFGGNGQFSKKGTPITEPLSVIVRFEDGSAAPRVVVRFEIKSGGGTITRTTDNTDDAGIAETQLTLGPVAGTNTVRAYLDTDPSTSVEFVATAGDYFCPEEDPTFTRKFTGRIVLFTRHSSFYGAPADPGAGLLKITPNFNLPPRAAVQPMVSLPDEEPLTNVPKDCAIGRTGDLFLSWKSFEDEIAILDQGLSYRHFATLEDALRGSEVSASPGAILMGTDGFGPFGVSCGDTLTRFAGAFYSGNGNDRCNDNAMAIDPATQDLYFIYLGDNKLWRLPLDSLTVEGVAEEITTLTPEEAEHARGMVFNDDGNVYILVDTETPRNAGNTKLILRVTPAGVKTTLYDFYSRGPGAAAGWQSDLALESAGADRLLYTVDTRNNMLLVYNITQSTFTEMAPDPFFSGPYAISDSLSAGERVGIMVLP
jgi:hypothetical protein